MEQRAQRAAWMKTDLEPDAEMPMIIDYINTPLGPNNAIKSAYIGGGYYSGYVIDCDGTIIHSVNWAWFAPGGQWWFLPLAGLGGLDTFLADYLADPPACYVTSRGSPRQSVPAPQSRVSGLREGQPTVLIVDDDGGSAYEGYFKITLGNLKKHYAVWNVQDEGSPPISTLDDFRAVAWLTGDASEDTLTATDQANLAAYLDGGGKLLISGQNIGQDLQATDFYRDYLHAALIDPDAGIDELLGEDILDTLDFAITGADGEGNQNAPSEIGLLDGAIGILRYDKPGAPAWAALRWEGDCKVAYFAFGLEGIGERGAGAFRFKLIREVFAWFEEGEPVPALSNWGLVGMAVLALAAGTWVFTRFHRLGPEAAGDD
jgi:hypothetical protein